MPKKQKDKKRDRSINGSFSGQHKTCIHDDDRNNRRKREKKKDKFWSNKEN